MALADFILLPDYQVFETAFLARNNSEEENPCLNLFRKAWSYFIDNRDKVVVISQELDKQLMESHYKSEHKKRQALFSIVRVHSEGFNCPHMVSQIKLSSILSIEEDKDVYFVTDNPQMKDLLKNNSFKIIDSAEAVKLIETIL